MKGVKVAEEDNTPGYNRAFMLLSIEDKLTTMYKQQLETDAKIETISNALARLLLENEELKEKLIRK